MKCFAQLKTENLFAAVDASVESLKQQLQYVHSLVATAASVKLQLQEAVNKDPHNKKFSTFKAAGGTIDDFFKGLEDRIGKCSNEFYCVSAKAISLTLVFKELRISTSKKPCVQSTPLGAEAHSPSPLATTTSPLSRSKSGRMWWVMRAAAELNARTEPTDVRSSPSINL